MYFLMTARALIRSTNIRQTGYLKQKCHKALTLRKDAQPSSFFPKGLIMRTFINRLLAKWSGAVSAGLCFVLMALAILISPEISPRHNAQAAIDETMPDSLPAEVIADWKDQDSTIVTNYTNAATAIVNNLPAEFAEKFNTKKTDLSEEKLYLLACHFRRVSRMKKHEADLENIMFARHGNFDGFKIGYHDNSDPSNSAWHSGGGALCLLNFKDYYPASTDLLSKLEVILRDPCISFDGKKVLFAISGKGAGKGYKIYEMEIADTSTLTQLTFDDPGLSDNSFTVADFEPCYLPSGDIMFTSTRNFGMDFHGSQPSTNMFLMNGQGKYMRQVGFDQAHTFYPVIMEDGSILYSRHEYNDRSFINCMGLFTMNPDGAHQTEYFGNQTGWPFTMIHARPIPGTHSSKVICVAGGFHGPYAGELMIIDRNKGTNGLQSIRMIAPLRETKPDVTKSDISMGNVNFLFQTPYPLDENDFLVSWRKSESVTKYRLYFMNVDSSRELLAWADQSVGQPVVIKPWEKIPPQIKIQADYKDSIGSFRMKDIYFGEGMKGIMRGAAKTLRVVALHFKAAGGNTGMITGAGPSGTYSTAITCPVSAYGASWDAKEVLGETKIYEDGSAAFTVPARTPVYFQVLDSNGYCIATMRSWSTLMPGEKFECLGCHESKLCACGPVGTIQAGDPKPLDKPLGVENKPFDYKQFVQPIFDNKCAKCHTATHESGFDLTGDLTGSTANKKWTTSYNSLLKGIPVATSNNAINICTIYSEPEQQRPYSFGSSLSGIMTKALNGTNTKMNTLCTDKEIKIIACWIDLMAPHAGKYNSYLSAPDSTSYQAKLDKRLKWGAVEKVNINALLAATVDKSIDQGSKKIIRATGRLSIGYLPKQHTLVLKKFSLGNFILVDLRGKVISRIRLSNLHRDGNVSISLPASLSTGIYVARFENVNGSQQMKISVAK
jgi:hypothetical protein